MNTNKSFKKSENFISKIVFLVLILVTFMNIPLSAQKTKLFSNNPQLLTKLKEWENKTTPEVNEQLFYLRTGDDLEKGNAANKLSGLKDKSSILELLKHLDDGTSLEWHYSYSRSSIVGKTGTSVGELCAEALASIGKPAVEPLIEMLNVKNSVSRINTIYALSIINDSSSVESVIKLLPDDKVGYIAAEALGEMKAKQAVYPLLSSIKEPLTAYYAIEAVGKIGDTTAVQPLIELLKKNDEYLTQSVIKALAILKDPRSVESLILLLQDNNDHVNLAAIAALGEIHDPRAVSPLILHLKNHYYSVSKYNTEILFATASSLAKFDDPRIIEPLLLAASFNSKNCPYYDQQIEKDLFSIDKSSAVQPLIAALNNQDSYIRALSANLLGRLSNSVSEEFCFQMVEPLLRVVRDTNEIVKINAVKSLGTIKDERAVDPLINLLKDNNSDVNSVTDSVLRIIITGEPPLDRTFASWETWRQDNMNAYRRKWIIGGIFAVMIIGLLFWRRRR